MSTRSVFGVCAVFLGGCHHRTLPSPEPRLRFEISLPAVPADSNGVTLSCVLGMSEPPTIFIRYVLSNAGSEDIALFQGGEPFVPATGESGNIVLIGVTAHPDSTELDRFIFPPHDFVYVKPGTDYTYSASLRIRDNGSYSPSFPYGTPAVEFHPLACAMSYWVGTAQVSDTFTRANQQLVSSGALIFHAVPGK